jgi:transposase
VKIDPNTLPDNPDVLRQMVIDLATQLDAHERRLQRVRNILEQLPRWRFGRKSEKLDERQMLLFAVQWEAEGRTPQQLAAELGLEENDPLEPEEAGSKRAKRRGHGRQRLPRTLTRERIEHELSEAERQYPHCAETMPRIGGLVNLPCAPLKYFAPK